MILPITDASRVTRTTRKTLTMARDLSLTIVMISLSKVIKLNLDPLEGLDHKFKIKG